MYSALDADSRIATLAVLVVSLLRFAFRHEVNMAEAFIYIVLALCIVGYWSFAAWIRVKEKDNALPDPESEARIEEIEKHVQEMRSKLNAVALRLGITNQ